MSVHMRLSFPSHMNTLRYITLLKHFPLIIQIYLSTFLQRSRLQLYYLVQPSILNLRYREIYQLHY